MAAKASKGEKDKEKVEKDDEGEWIDCGEYTLKIAGSDKDFDMILTGKGGEKASVRNSSSKPELISEVLGVLSGVWPKLSFQFQVGDKKRLTRIRIKPK